MTSKDRCKKLIVWAGLILGIGLAYAFISTATGLSIPCPFHAVTGLWCPGCGVSRMCLALLRLDFAAAWRANPLLLLLLPVLVGLLLRLAYGYVASGQVRLSRAHTVLVWTMVFLLFVYGVARNLPCLSFLAPGY